MPAKPKRPENIQSVKGMHDILPEEYLLRKKLLEKARSIAAFYGFRPIHTPHLEKIELFTAGLGETTDVVEKQMYTIKTRGGDKLVLRPEGTAPIVRAYLEHGMHTWPQPVMLSYEGAFFRHENPQKGRRRELHQFGLEILGGNDPITDALIIKVCLVILEEMGLKPLKVYVNSIGDAECRKVYQKELLAYYRRRLNNLCKDCKRRYKTNPLRLLDCKEEKCAQIRQGAPQIINYLCENCIKHFQSVLEILEVCGIQYSLDHYLVRGLDYYTRTVFEIFLDNEEIPVATNAPSIPVESAPEEQTNPEPGADQNPNPNLDPNQQNKPENEIDKDIHELKSLALAGGGRYDYLAKMIGKKDIPAVGCAIGMDRVTEIVKRRGHLAEKEKPSKVFFIQLGEAAKQRSINILESLRKAHVTVSHSLSKDSLKGQLKMAAKLKIPFALLYGQKEALDNTIMVRNMEMSSQETIPLPQLIDYLKKK